MRRLFGSPLFWAIACFGFALPWVLAGNTADFFPVVCLLVSGFFAGLVAMRLLARIPSRRAGLAAHIGLAGALALYGVLFVPRIGEATAWLRSVLPDPLVSLAWALWFTSITLTAVVWLTLLGRVLAALPGGRASDLPAPVWVGSEDGAQTEFTAVEMSRHAYLATVVACAAAVLGVGVAVFIAAEPLVSRLSPKLLLLAFGVLLMLPVYLAARAYFRARTRAWRVTFTEGRMRIAELQPTREGAARDWLPVETDQGEDRVAEWTVAFADIDSLVWCEAGEAARIEVRSRRGDRTLLVGVAKPLAGKRAALPGLSRRVRAELGDAGLGEAGVGQAGLRGRSAKGRPGQWRFVRAGASDSRP